MTVTDQLSTPAVESPPGLFVDRYRQVRAFTQSLCEPLVTEDYVVQSMPDVSPTKWHLAHTTWFFETFILSPHLPGYQPFDPHFAYLFNSYYVTVGDQHCRHLVFAAGRIRARPRGPRESAGCNICAQPGNRYIRGPHSPNAGPRNRAP